MLEIHYTSVPNDCLKDFILVILTKFSRFFGIYQFHFLFSIGSFLSPQFKEEKIIKIKA